MRVEKKLKLLNFALLLTLSLIGITRYTTQSVFAASDGPDILITEVMPYSRSYDDAYEYIEFYNNTDENLNLKNYKLPTQNVDITASKVISPGSSVVICTLSKTTLEEFNDFYNTSLTEDKYFTLPLVSEVLSNDSYGTIVLAEDDNTVITQAKYNVSDFSIKKSITYKNPESEFTMEKLATKQNPTPGSIQNTQIPDYGVDVTSITLDKESVILDKNQSATLHATIFPSTATNKAVLWKSEDTDIATVSQSGVITAKSEGYTIITARTVDGNFMDICAVTVHSIKVKGISLNKLRATIEEGKALVLTASIIPDNATNKNLEWYSSNNNVATVNSNGVVVGKSPGFTVISAKTVDGNYIDTCTVEVINKDTDYRVSGVEIKKDELNLEVGKVVVLEAQVKPESSLNKNISWFSSNSEVASVDENGIVTARKVGKSWITVKTKDGGFEDKCLITVGEERDEVSSNIKVRFSRPFIFIEKGEFKDLPISITPRNYRSKNNDDDIELDDIKNISFETSDSDVVTITSDGKVKGVNDGIAVITIKQGNYSSKCVVYVADDEKFEDKFKDKFKDKFEDRYKDKGNKKGHTK